MNQSDLEAITRITRHSREKSERGSNGLRKWREFFLNQSQFEVNQYSKFSKQLSIYALPTYFPFCRKVHGRLPQAL